MDSEKISIHILESIKMVLSKMGLPEFIVSQVDSVLYLVVIVIIGILAGAVAHFVAKGLTRRIQSHKSYTLLDKLLEYDALKRATSIIPPVVVIFLLPVAFTRHPKLLSVFENLTWIYFTVVLVRSLSAILSSVGGVAGSNRKFHDRPIKGFIQITKIVIYIVAVIVVISILTNKSPFYLIGGLGAFAAVLMLVFKDTITGFVGGILLLENDMMRLGDWIEIPGTAINGTVVDMSLTIVKVMNFDNTIVTIPPYSLISGSFVNWRSMSESCGRRIMRGYTIKSDNIYRCTPEFLDRIMGISPQMERFITAMRDGGDGLESEERFFGSVETNLGLFRAYATYYLKGHPMLNKQMLIMVRTLVPTENGVPLQIYCFTADTVWNHYESIQAEIMEHLATMLPLFDLLPYQSSSSQDSLINGLVERGYPIENIAGIPLGVLK